MFNPKIQCSKVVFSVPAFYRIYVEYYLVLYYKKM